MKQRSSKDYYSHFAEDKIRETGTLWSSLSGGEAAGAELLPPGATSTVQKSPGCAAAAKLCNTAKDSWSQTWKGENSVSLRKKQGILKYHRLGQNPAATYQLCPWMNYNSLCTSVSPSSERSLSGVTHGLWKQHSLNVRIPQGLLLVCFASRSPGQSEAWNYG